MTLTLGGPGVACSASTVRRLAAGELSGEAARRAEAHLGGCARCQATARELTEERAALAAELPFDRFAAGVAERLATGVAGRQATGAAAGAAPDPARLATARPAWRRALPLALAAALALGVAAPLLGRLAAGRGPLAPDDATRVKGGAAATLWLREAGGARPLEPGEPIPAGGALRLALAPAGRGFAAAALRDEDGVALLLAGPADEAGQAFEWTGRRGELVVVYDDAPVDGAALVERLRRGGPAAAAPGPGAEVVLLPLVRSGP